MVPAIVPPQATVPTGVGAGVKHVIVSAKFPWFAGSGDERPEVSHK